MRWLPVTLLAFAAVLSAQPRNTQGARQTAAPQTPTANAQDEPPKTARLEGIVRSTTGEPVPRATLRLQGGVTNGTLPATYTITSGDDGSFVLENIPPGRNYRLSAQRPGFVNTQYGARGSMTAATPLTLAAGQVLKGLLLEMTPQGVITGKITDRNGDPVVNAMVMVMQPRMTRGQRTYATRGTATSNDQGEYRLANLPPGRYYLRVEERNNLVAAIQRTSPDASRESNILTYYTNAADLATAVPLNITAGAELRGIDIRMLHGPSYVIRGHVAGIDGGSPLLMTIAPKNDDPAMGLPVILTRGLQPARPPDGAFEFSGVTPGAYTIQALPSGNINGQPTAPLVVRADVTVSDADIDGLVIQATAGATLTGSVRMEDADLSSLFPQDSGQPAAGAPAGALAVIAGLRQPAVTLAPAQPTPLAPVRPGQIQEDGSFTIEGAAPDKYRVSLSTLPDGVYVKSITFGGQDVTHGTLDLTSGAGGALNVLLSAKAADLTGAVRNEDGEALASVYVTIWPKDGAPGDPSGGMRTAVTDQNGGFQLRSIPPGKYYAAAWEDPEAPTMLSAELLSKFTSAATEIELGESAHQAIEPKVIPEEKLAEEAAKLP